METDVDRYIIDGQLRQLLLTPRELDVRQLPEAARSRWPNTHFVYTHGYGLVVAEANRITLDGLPVLFVQDAPPVVKTPSLKLTRPELYYSEVQHEPVFVHTAQPEFDYPVRRGQQVYDLSGQGRVPRLFVRDASRRGGFGSRSEYSSDGLPDAREPDDDPPARARSVQTLAGFLTWETDPYLVMTDDGRLVWTIDGYTTSAAHPYSRLVELGDLGEVNYMRNAVKATVDAYDGETHIYVFDGSTRSSALTSGCSRNLFQPFSEMPADLRAHARYPEIALPHAGGDLPHLPHDRRAGLL